MTNNHGSFGFFQVVAPDADAAAAAGDALIRRLGAALGLTLAE
jgi:hypothetical protein